MKLLVLAFAALSASTIAMLSFGTSEAQAPSNRCAAGHLIGNEHLAHADDALRSRFDEPTADHEQVGTQWFQPLDDYLNNPSFNPEQRQLSADEAELVNQVFEQAEQELDAVAEAYSQAQREVAQRRIEERTAEPYIEGVTDVTAGNYAAVVVTTGGEQGSWVVRLSPEELPMMGDVHQRILAIRRHALDVLRGVIRG